MKIITQGKIVEESDYELFFQSKCGMQGTGYSFRCSQTGMIHARNYDGELLSREAQENYKRMWNHPDYQDPVILEYPRRYIIPAVGICVVCEAEVVLDDPFLSPCDKCGTDYNGSGQRLTPRSQWGEETGEHPADIITGYYNPREDW